MFGEFFASCVLSKKAESIDKQCESVVQVNIILPQVVVTSGQSVSDVQTRVLGCHDPIIHYPILER